MADNVATLNSINLIFAPTATEASQRVTSPTSTSLQYNIRATTGLYSTRAVYSLSNGDYVNGSVYTVKSGLGIASSFMPKYATMFGPLSLASSAVSGIGGAITQYEHDHNLHNALLSGGLSTSTSMATAYGVSLIPSAVEATGLATAAATTTVLSATSLLATTFAVSYGATTLVDKATGLLDKDGKTATDKLGGSIADSLYSDLEKHLEEKTYTGKIKKDRCGMPELGGQQYRELTDILVNTPGANDTSSLKHLAERGYPNIYDPAFMAKALKDAKEKFANSQSLAEWGREKIGLPSQDRMIAADKLAIAEIQLNSYMKHYDKALDKWPPMKHSDLQEPSKIENLASNQHVIEAASNLQSKTTLKDEPNAPTPISGDHSPRPPAQRMA